MTIPEILIWLLIIFGVAGTFGALANAAHAALRSFVKMVTKVR